MQAAELAATALVSLGSPVLVLVASAIARAALPEWAAALGGLLLARGLVALAYEALRSTTIGGRGTSG